MYSGLANMSLRMKDDKGAKNPFLQCANLSHTVVPFIHKYQQQIESTWSLVHFRIYQCDEDIRTNLSNLVNDVFKKVYMCYICN